MNQADFARLVAAIFDRIGPGSGELMDRYHYTNDGVLAVCAEEVGKVGFGIASQFSLTSDLVEKVSDLNRRMQFGHYWLSRGADDSNWLLIFGMKFHYESVSSEHVIDLVAAVANHHAAIADSVRDYLSDFSHQPYRVDGSSPDAAALVLMGHLA
jgi:hypothetical protein